MYKDIKLTPINDSIKILNISDDEYFSSKYKQYISNSSLALINPSQGGSPSKYKEGLVNNTKYSSSLVFGSAIHQMILQPESFFVVDDIDRPTAKLGLVADYLYNHFTVKSISIEDSQLIEASNEVNYYKNKLTESRKEAIVKNTFNYLQKRKAFEDTYSGNKEPIFLDANSREKLGRCIYSYTHNKNIYDILSLEDVSRNEETLFFDIHAAYRAQDTVLHLKAKLDNFGYNDSTIILNDLKTTGHWLDKFSESFKQYHYYRQVAMYVWMLYHYCIKENISLNPDIYVNMLLISTIPEYKSGVFRVNNNNIRRGIIEMKDLLQRVAYCTITNNFTDGNLESNI